MKVLVTGGAGFIGSSFVRYLIRTRTDIDVVNYDLLTYAGNLRNLDEVENDPRYTFVRGDIADSGQVDDLFERYGFDAVVNFARRDTRRSFNPRFSAIHTYDIGGYAMPARSIAP